MSVRGTSTTTIGTRRPGRVRDGCSPTSARGTPEAQAAFYNGYNRVSNCKNLNGSLSGHPGAADQFGRCVLNPGGIDLSVAAAARLGLGHLQNGWVTVTFLWEKKAAPRQPNILWNDTTTGRTTLWIMSKTTKVGAVALKPATFPPPWSPVATADFNGDGHTDILWWNRDTNALKVWFMNGATRIGSSAVNPNGPIPGSAWKPVAADDFNRDGHPDVLWHDTSTGHVQIWYMRRTTRESTTTITLPSGASWPTTDWSPFATARFNAGRIPDIAWHSSSTGHVMIWYLSGADGSTLASSQAVSLASGAVWPSPSTWTPAGSGDFNRDGQPDLLWHNTSNGSLVVWMMGGSDGSAMLSSVGVKAPSFPSSTKVPIVWR